jgi:hypothetical protein
MFRHGNLFRLPDSQLNSSICGDDFGDSDFKDANKLINIGGSVNGGDKSLISKHLCISMDE